MPYLKAGYFIDEIYHHLERVVGEPVLQEFYERNLSFEVKGFPKKLRISGVNPLAKVAWNILSRGRPTRASLRLSQYILNLHLGDDEAVEQAEKDDQAGEKESEEKDKKEGEDVTDIGPVSLNMEGPEVKLELNWPELGELKPELVIPLLKEFASLSAEKVSKDYGEPYLTLFKILRDLHISARVQQLLLLMYLGYYPTDDFFVNIKGMDEALATAVIEDLNELFQYLNALISVDEEALKPIVQDDSIKAHTLTYESSSAPGFSISSVSWDKVKEAGPEVPFFLKVLTDRRVAYTPLKKKVEAVDETAEESKKVDEEGTEAEPSADEDAMDTHTGADEDAKEWTPESFEYQAEKQEAALRYLLRNIFRKSGFRPGQETMIDRALRNQHVISLLPPGGGKSLPWQLCGLLQPGITLIVEPTYSLMKDQYDGLTTGGIDNGVCFHSGDHKDDGKEKLRDMLKSEFHFVFLSPEWLHTHEFRNQLKKCAKNSLYFSYAVIDEIHCVSEWGHDFRTDYVNLPRLLKEYCEPKDENLCLFGLTSAVTFDVMDDILREMESTPNAVISQPNEGMVRKELNFKIMKLEDPLDSKVVQNMYTRIQGIGRFKHQELVNNISTLPGIFRELSGKAGDADREPVPVDEFFGKDEKGEYPHAGVIYCPVSSETLRNGVLSVKNSLEKNLNFLDIATFYDGGDEDEVGDQKAFKDNKKNLMIATEDYGIGLDKSKIRYTYHYSFPNSVEHFYQQAGRAGRDGAPALCAILYHPEDIRTRIDFFEDKEKGLLKEKEILKELLVEVQYEEGFHPGIIDRKAKQKFSAIGKVSFRENRYLYIFGPYDENPEKQVQIAAIDVQDGLKIVHSFTRNFDKKRAAIVGRYVIELLKKEAGDQNPLEWLKVRSVPGISALLNKDAKATHTLRIGFKNNVMNQLSDYLSRNNRAMGSGVVQSAYGFCRSPEEFVENLRIQYKQQGNATQALVLEDEEVSEIKSAYWKIRTRDDTFRALYRMKIAGVIDDYVADYEAGFVTLNFQAKGEDTYLDNLRNYLRRYLGDGSTARWMRRARDGDEKIRVAKVLFTLVEFMNREISEKNKRAIYYMQQLCEMGFEQGQEVFRQSIEYYYTSKYSAPQYLPKDTDNGKKESTAIVKKYLGYINRPPDGQGSELSNARYLRAACDELRIDIGEENNSINLLTAYTYFALETQESTDVETALTHDHIQQAIKYYTKGFKQFQEEEPWKKVVQLMGVFNTKVLNMNPVMKPVLVPLTNKMLVKRTASRLKKFLNQIESHE